jgi:uncharacterized protein (DUF362 family)
MNSVSFCKSSDSSIAKIKQGIAQSLDLINYHFKEGITKVVIKPNMCYYLDCSTGETTDPKFVGAFIDLIRERINPDLDIAIVESDASAMKCKYAFRMLKYEKLAEDKNVKVLNLSEEESNDASVTCNGQNYNFMVPTVISQADLRVNITKIKYMVDPIRLTCALKNIYGCNPYPKKYKYHSDLGNVIVALNKAMKFDLCMVDANVVYGVNARKLGLTMASQDPVAIDVAAARIAWLNPSKIPYLFLAEKEGIGSRAYTAVGEPLGSFRAMFPKRTFKMKMKQQAYKMVVHAGLGRRLGLE